MNTEESDKSEKGTPHSRTPRLWTKRAVVFGLSLLLSMCAVELGFRIKAPMGHEAMLFGSPDFSDPDLYVSDPALLLVPNPGYEGSLRTIEYQADVRINSNGIRGPEIGAREAGELRLLALGDSFTLAVQVAEEETFSARLESLLEQRLERPVRILNAGVDGFGTQQSTAMARRLHELYDVDGAVLLFFTGNDFWENDSFPERLRMHGGMRMPPPEPELSFWDRTLGRLSYAYAYVRVHFRTRAMRSDPHQLQRYGQELKIFDASSPVLNQQMRTTQQALQDFSSLCKEEKWACFLPVAPPAFVADPKRAEATFDLVGMSMEQVDLERPSEALMKTEHPGLPQLDLLPVLRASKSPTYFRFDGHWNAEGHRLVADALAAWMADRLQGYSQ